MDVQTTISVLTATKISEISAIDIDWINDLNRSEALKTLSWASSINAPSIDKHGLGNLLQINDKPKDALASPPLDWGLKLKETNVTKAIAQFLKKGNKDQQILRAKEFLSSFGIKNFDDCQYFYIKNEHPIKDGRIDVLVAWGDSLKKKKFRYGLVCEFKLDSDISDGQLKKYENGAAKYIDLPSFVFISRRYKNSDLLALKNTKKSWQSRLWWKFLRSWEHQISTESDDPEFRQFRSTLWNQMT